ncbi:MAG TPA: hypothetical protein VN873_16125 [Candidatus Angelobacter sp.]|nr:hypothetical protein [Candidatus Angelobacter sp.]
MQKSILVFIAVFLGIIQSIMAASYSTEATMSLHKEDGYYFVEAKISELTEHNGTATERMISRPRIQSMPGVAASFYVGPKRGDSDYKTKENVSVDVTWPYPNESGAAACVVVVKRGDEVVSRSRFQLKVDGPGRVPLVLAAPDVDAKSVKVADDKYHQNFVFLELIGKSKEEVKKLAYENYGNQVQIRDANGNLMDGGLSFGDLPWCWVDVEVSGQRRGEAGGGGVEEGRMKNAE